MHIEREKKESEKKKVKAKAKTKQEKKKKKKEREHRMKRKFGVDTAVRKEENTIECDAITDKDGEKQQQRKICLEIHETLFDHKMVCPICKHLLKETCIYCKQTKDYSCDISVGDCRHIYHKHCLDKYLLRGNTLCLICKEKWIFKELQCIAILFRVISKTRLYVKERAKQFLLEKPEFEYSIEKHSYWPKSFKAQVFALLLVSKYRSHSKIELVQSQFIKGICLIIIKALSKECIKLL